MDDYISRQAAIRNVCEKECRVLKPCNAECGSIIALRELPSADAQPENRTEKHAETHMRDLISRADVEQTVEDNILCYTHSDRPIDQDPDTEYHVAIRTALRMLRKDLRKLPSADVVDVVRCKDCRCFDVATNGVNGFCNKLGVPFDVYDYCSMGERKDGEQNDKRTSNSMP